MQAAYKAVASNNFSDVLHLGGGVYGAHEPLCMSLEQTSVVAPAWQVAATVLDSCMHYKALCDDTSRVQGGSKQACLLRESTTWRMLVSPAPAVSWGQMLGMQSFV